MSELHTVLFKKNIWTIPKAQQWLSEHNIKPIKAPRETKNFYRIRIKDPKLFKSFSTKVLDNGIELVFGFFNKMS